MNMDVLRLAFAVFWLVVAALAFYAGHVASEPPLGGRFDSTTLDLAVGIGTVLAVWNLVRWFLGRQRAVPSTNPLERQRDTTTSAREPEEYNPEFDFRNQPPKPGP